VISSASPDSVAIIALDGTRAWLMAILITPRHA
jgi:hypothetical protein